MSDAEDATQEAFLEAYQLSLDRTKWERIRHPRLWIHHVALMRHQRPAGPRRRVPADLVADFHDEPLPDADHAELTAQTQDVLAALRSLGEVDEQAQAVMLYRLDDFPYSAIAEHLKISVQRARDLQKKARRHLMPLLTRQRSDTGGGGQ